MLLVLLGGGLSVVCAAQTPDWDPNRYIDVDEIHPGQEAYCLTVYQGTTVERFALDVVDVVHGFQPGLDVILVQGRDERFVHTGPVAGCSGSPVYIAGRMAGALALGWPLSKDPLYGVTPIRAMLGIGQGRSTTGHTSASGLGWDFRQPLDFQRISTTASGYSHATPEAADPVLPCPLLCSGLSASGQRYVTDILTPHGFLPVAAGTGLGGGTKGASAGFVPGSVLMVPLVDGDVRLAVLGTVTEVREDRVFGFGHSFLGQGEIELPLATGQIHTVVSNLSRSFKLGSVLQTVGALIQDEPVGVVGILGRQAPTIPVTLHIDHYLRSQGIDYTCRVARHLSLTPELLKALIEGTVMGLGALPPDHTVTYEAAITLQTGRVLRWTNVSTGSGLRELLMEMLGSVALLLNNPFQVVEIGAIDLAVAITPVNTMSYIAALEVPDRRLKPGDTVRVQVTLETFRADKQRHDLTVTLPQDIAPGKYTLSIGGSYDYQRTLRQRAPHKLMAHDVSSLLDALDFALHQERDRLYCVLELPGKGLALERQEMPYLPESRALILRSAKRTAPWTPILPWLETNRRLDTVIMDGEKLTIEVE